MQQSLQLLQTPTLELRQLIQQELNNNPTLEDDTFDVSLEDAKTTDEDEEFDRELAELSQRDEEWREYMAQSRIASPRRDDADERYQYMMDSIIDPITLQSHLINQLSFSPVSGELKKVCEMLIGNIDDNGFLQVNIEEVCLDQRIPIDLLLDARGIIQSFDPVGIGAEDLRDCLLIQLERMGKHHSLEYQIVEHYLEELAKKRYPQIAKKLSVLPEQISLAAAFIATLDPRPGSRFSNDNNTYVVPDVVVERNGNEWVVVTNDEQIPRLKISQSYKDLLATDEAKAARSYIRDKIKSGKFLIKCIQQRQQTIRGIAEQIVIRQKEFFEKGPSQLKPMNMAQIAQTIQVHETTVSRAVSGKYIATPHGVFEMKYFFTTGYQKEDGQSLSNTSVKQTLAAIIAEEDPKKPLSDQVLVEKMEEKGIKLARRTVAKYREELNILPSHMRRTY